MFRVYRFDGEGRYVGDDAAEWFSNYLKKPGYKMYQLSKPRVICEDKKWGDIALPDDKVITRNTTYNHLAVNSSTLLGRQNNVFHGSVHVHAIK